MVEETKEVVEDRKKKLEEEQKLLDEEQKKKAEETEPIDKIDKANEAAERLERANKKHEELVLRQERIAVDNKLGGSSEAGAQQLTPEEKKADDIKKGAKSLVPDGMECPGVTD